MRVYLLLEISLPRLYGHPIAPLCKNRMPYFSILKYGARVNLLLCPENGDNLADYE
jgi:hypothetical protein